MNEEDVVTDLTIQELVDEQETRKSTKAQYKQPQTGFTHRQGT